MDIFEKQSEMLSSIVINIFLVTCKNLISLLVVTFLFDAGIVGKGSPAWVFSAAQGPLTACHFTCVFLSVGIND